MIEDQLFLDWQDRSEIFAASLPVYEDLTEAYNLYVEKLLAFGGDPVDYETFRRG